MGVVKELWMRHPGGATDAFLSDEEAESALVTLMPEEERAAFLNYGHRWVESAFVGRTFVVYRAGQGRREAEVLATYDVTNLAMDGTGVSIELENRRSGERLVVDHTPRRLGRYGVFMQVPIKTLFKLNARRDESDLRWLQSIGLLFKTKNKPDFHNKGNTYLCTLAEFSQKFPSQK